MTFIMLLACQSPRTLRGLVEEGVTSHKSLRLALGFMIFLISHLLAVFFTRRNTQPDGRLLECVLQEGRWEMSYAALSNQPHSFHKNPTLDRRLTPGKALLSLPLQGPADGKTKFL